MSLLVQQLIEQRIWTLRLSCRANGSCRHQSVNPWPLSVVCARLVHYFTMQPAEEQRSPERTLSLSDHELATAGNLLTEFLRSFERSLDDRRVMPVFDRNQLSELFAMPFPDVGIGIELLFRDIQEKVLPNCTTVAHRRFLALLGPVHINGRDGIRACITNYRTSKSDMDFVMDRLLRLGEAVDPSGNP